MDPIFRGDRSAFERPRADGDIRDLDLPGTHRFGNHFRAAQVMNDVGCFHSAVTLSNVAQHSNMICSAIACDTSAVNEHDLDSEGGRLRWARMQAGYREAGDFASTAKIHRTTYRAYENNQNGYAKHAPHFASILGVPTDWLLRGGPTPSVRQRSNVAKQSDSPAVINESQGETAAIISLDLSLSMGAGTPIEDFVESEPLEFDIGLLRAITRSPYHRLRVVRGIGNSMEPKFYSGDRILVDTTERQLSRIDGYYWITLWGAHGLKRLRPAGPQRVLVISENKDHEPIEVDASDITIEGRAIWFARDL